MSTFEDLVNLILNEYIVSGGEESAFGSGVTSTSGPFSGDNYAKGDARTPKMLGSKVIKRNMAGDSVFTGKRKHKKRRSKKRAHKAK